MKNPLFVRCCRFALLVGLIGGFTLFGATPAFAVPTIPSILAQPDHGWVSGRQWAATTEVTLTVDDDEDPGNGTLYQSSETTDGDGAALFNDIEPGVDLVPGLYLSMTDGVITKSMQVAEVHFDLIDEATDATQGRGPANTTATVYIQTDVAQQSLGIALDGSGNWTADFSGLLDIQNVQDANIEVHHDGDGDGTMAHWPGTPNVRTQPNHGWVAGWNWPLGLAVVLTVDDDPDFSSPLHSDAQYPNANMRVWFNVEPTIDLVPGQYVRLENGLVTKTMQIVDASFDAIDEAADIAYGRGPVGAEGTVYIVTDVDENNLDVTISGAGQWSADFSGLLDIQNVQDARLELLDADGDGTLAHWPGAPKILTQPDHGWVRGENWPAGIEVDIKVDDAADFLTPAYTGSATPGGDMSVFFNDIEASIDLVPGLYIWMSNGLATKTLQIDAVYFDYVNPSIDLTSGRGPANRSGWVWVVSDGGGQGMDTATDTLGNWSADFGDVGFDIQNIYDANVQFFDGDGDSTMAHLPSDTLHVVPSGSEVHGHDWHPGSIMTLVIDTDTDPGNGTLYTETKSIDADTSCGSPCFNLNGVFTLAAGQYVFLSDGYMTKLVWVADFYVTNINPVANTVSGHSSPSALVDVTLHSQNASLQVNADGSGNWTADFTGVADLVVGDFGRAIQLNGDATDDGTLQYWSYEVPVVTIEPEADPVKSGQAVQVTVNVTGSMSVPTGTVSITGADTNCTITLAGGSGYCNVVFKAPGNRTITATYNGDVFHPKATDTEPHTVTPLVMNFASVATHDGWILESKATSNQGGLFNNSSDIFNLGDDSAKKQYRGVLSFNTAALPDNAVITKVTLQIRRKAVVGGATFAMFQGLIVEIKKGFLGTAAALAASDFEAAPNAAYGPYLPAPVGSLYTMALPAASRAYVNKLATSSGLTQLRLRFKLGDNGNAVANYISFFSGNATVASNRPKLIIEYYVP